MDVNSSEPSPSSSVLRATLSNPNYAKLLTGQVIAASGDRINQIALLSIILTKGNTSKYTADIMFWAVLPTVLLSPFALALIDRWDRRKTMITSDIVRACIVASLPLLLILVQHYYIIYAVVFLVGIFSALFGASRLAIMPDLVPPKLLMPSNAFSSQAGTVGSLIAIPIGTAIVENWEINSCFLINSLTYFVSALFVMRLNTTSSEQRIEQVTAHRPWDNLKSGLQYIRNNHPILFYVVFYGAVQCLVAIFFDCFMEYAADSISDHPSQKLRTAIALFGTLVFGMIGGALSVGKFSKSGKRFLLPVYMIIPVGIALWGLSYATRFRSAGLLLLIVGFFAMALLAPLDTYLQRNVPDEYRGRVFVARGICGGIAFLISLQLSKAIVHHWGIPGTWKFLGVFALTLGITGLVVGSLIKKTIEQKA